MERWISRSTAISVCLLTALAGHVVAENAFEGFDSLPRSWPTFTAVWNSDGHLEDSSVAGMRVEEGSLVVSFDVPEQTGIGTGADHVLWTPYGLPDGSWAMADVVVGPEAATYARVGLVVSLPDGTEIRWMIGPDGTWTRSLYLVGGFSFLDSVLDQPGEVIVVGADEVNRLGLRRDGRSFMFTINGYVVDEYEPPYLGSEDYSLTELGLIFEAGAPERHTFKVKSYRLQDYTTLPRDLPLPYAEDFNTVFTGWYDNYYVTPWGELTAYATHTGEGYIMWARARNSVYVSAPIAPPEGDWVASADIWHPATQGTPAYGLGFTALTGETYVCYVTPFDVFTVCRRASARDPWTVEVPVTDSSFLGESQEETHVELVARSNNMTFYANGVELHSIRDTIGVEEIALALRSFADESSESCSVSIRSFSVKPLEAVAEAGLLSDSFSSASTGWATDSRPDVLSRYANGRYMIQVKPAQQTYWSKAPIETLPMSFDVEVSAGRASGPLGGYYGIILGIDEDDIFFFEVSADGWYIVEWMADGQWQSEPVGWTESAAIRADGGENMLLVRVSEDSIEFLANGEVLASLQRPAIPFAFTGLVAATYENPNFEAWFDDFVVDSGN